MVEGVAMGIVMWVLKRIYNILVKSFRECVLGLIGKPSFRAKAGVLPKTFPSTSSMIFSPSVLAVRCQPFQHEPGVLG